MVPADALGRAPAMQQVDVLMLIPRSALRFMDADRYKIRREEADAVSRAERIISGRCWWRLSDAIVRRARRAWLINMSIDMRLTMPGLGRTRSRWATWVDTDIGPHHAEAAAYLGQERIALRWAYNSTMEEI